MDKFMMLDGFRQNCFLFLDFPLFSIFIIRNSLLIDFDCGWKGIFVLYMTFLLIS